ncbi:MAG: Uma2 family endonuclease [Chloroflexota bacterium]|nr:Uma2 family endonuclease [Chloroflexota bacterium]
MATEIAERLMSAQEFLEWECAQPYQHELIDNRVYDMTGATPSHNLINLDLAFALKSRLYRKGCQIYGMNIQVQVDLAATFTYPDVVVVCGEPRFRHETSLPMLENPTLLFEILSPSTERIDRNRKRELYLRIPSLAGYFLVAQDRPLIEAYMRNADDWRLRIFSGMDATLVIPTPNCEIPLSEIYQQASFADA